MADAPLASPGSAETPGPASLTRLVAGNPARSPEASWSRLPNHAGARVYRRALRFERDLAGRDELEQLRAALGLFALGASLVGLLTMSLLPRTDRVAGLAVLLAAAVAGAALAARPRPVVPAPVLTAGAVTMQTSYAVVTGDADSPFLPGFLLIVLLVGVFSPPGRTIAAALLASAGLMVSAAWDQRLESSELLTVLTTSIGILVAGTMLSLLAWRRRVWVRRVHQRASRSRAIVARRTAESRTDPLTGHGNRRAFEDDLGARLAAHGPGSVGLVFADVDRLKGVNDRDGHGAGDRMLRVIADAFAGSLRAGEHVYRLGGDEFVAIIGGEDLRGIADRLGARLEVDVDGIGACSASVGTISGRPGETASELVRRADRAMYRVKGSKDWRPAQRIDEIA